MTQNDIVIINGREAIVVNTSWTTLQYKYERFGQVFSISLSDLKAQQLAAVAAPKPETTVAPKTETFMFHVPHGLTYNDMLTEFTDTKYHWASRVAVIKSIKATFKKLTGVGINELVSGYNYQQVIDVLSNAKIPHCTFADWLRHYEWKTPQQSEAGVAGNTFAHHVAEVELEEVLAIEPVEDEVYKTTLQPKPEPLKVIDVFVAVYGEGENCFDRLTNFLTKRDQYDYEHGIDNPWEIVDDEVENHLRGWFRNLYPTKAQLAKLY